MTPALYKIKNTLLDIMLPKKCVGCGKEGLYICNDCSILLNDIEFRSGDVMSVWEYGGLMERVMDKIRNGGCYDIITELVDKFFDKVEINLPWDMQITYVPMDGDREKRRGFNQSRLIAEAVAKRLGRTALPLLSKRDGVKQQSEVSVDKREANVRGAFSYNYHLIPSRVMVVDDFYITGATVNECRRILLDRGVKDIISFTLARKT